MSALADQRCWEFHVFFTAAWRRKSLTADSLVHKLQNTILLYLSYSTFMNVKLCRSLQIWLIRDDRRGNSVVFSSWLNHKLIAQKHDSDRTTTAAVDHISWLFEYISEFRSDKFNAELLVRLTEKDKFSESNLSS